MKYQRALKNIQRVFFKQIFEWSKTVKDKELKVCF